MDTIGFHEPREGRDRSADISLRQSLVCATKTVVCISECRLVDIEPSLMHDNRSQRSPNQVLKHSMR